MTDEGLTAEAYLAAEGAMALVLRERLAIDVTARFAHDQNEETISFRDRSDAPCEVVLTRVDDPLLRHLGLLTRAEVRGGDGALETFSTLLRAYGGHLRRTGASWTVVHKVEGLSTGRELVAWVRSMPKLDAPPPLPARPLRPLGTLPDLPIDGPPFDDPGAT